MVTGKLDSEAAAALPEVDPLAEADDADDLDADLALDADELDEARRPKHEDRHLRTRPRTADLHRAAGNRVIRRRRHGRRTCRPAAAWAGVRQPARLRPRVLRRPGATRRVPVAETQPEVAESLALPKTA